MCILKPAYIFITLQLVVTAVTMLDVVTIITFGISILVVIRMRHGRA